MGLLVCPLKLTYDKLATSVIAGNGKDHARQSRRASHHSFVHSRRRV